MRSEICYEMDFELRLTMCAPTDDDLEYFAEVSVDAATGENYIWAGVYLDNVDLSAAGPGRVEHAHAVVRMWFGDDHFDVPYSDVVAVLEAARTGLLVRESRVPPQ
jgi:hypothetical protein